MSGRYIRYSPFNYGTKPKNVADTPNELWGSRCEFGAFAQIGFEKHLKKLYEYRQMAKRFGAKIIASHL